MKHIICPYCGKTNIDSDSSYRFKCSFCKEWLIDLDKDHHKPETYFKERSNKNDCISSSKN